MFRFDINNKVRLFFRKDKESYLRLYKILGFYPNNIEFYKLALLHKSTRTVMQEGRYPNNERLEFLGDAVLDAVVGDIVYQKFQGKREGFLTTARSNIVKRETLNKLALEIGLDKLIKCDAVICNHNNYLYGNAFEALVGAIYLDRGYDYCMRFMKDRILQKYVNIEKASREVNYKSKLIEWTQRNRVEADFRLIEESKDVSQNSPIFKVELWLQGLYGGCGTGYSKRESQQLAAKSALRKLKNDSGFKKMVLTAAKNAAEE